MWRSFRSRPVLIGLATGLVIAAAGVTAAFLSRNAAGAGWSEASSASVYGKLISTDLGYVISSNDAERHLYLVDLEGHNWREVTPRFRGQWFYDVFFLNGSVGWVAAGNCGTAKWSAYRTKDGGRTWRSMEATSVNCAAGSGIEYVFLDRNQGWRAMFPGNANGGYIEHTPDGGRTWFRFASDEGSGSGYGVSGRVAAQGPLRVWVRHQNDEGSLKATRNGGRTWRSIRLKRRPPSDVRPNYPLEHYQLPTFFGRRAFLPVTYYRKRTVLVVYRSDDAGEHWRIAARRTFPRRCSPTIDPVSMRTWWLVGHCRDGARLSITADGGRTWRKVTLPSPSTATTRAWAVRVSAKSDRRAWISMAPDPDFVWHLYSTDDAGRTWRRIEPPSK